MEYDKAKACCFTGHRFLKQDDLKDVIVNLDREVKFLIKQGVTDFWCGGAIGFDTTAALYISTLKEQGFHIHLFLALPCKDQNQYWHERQKEIYNYMLSQADKIVFVSEKYTKDCMHLRNRFMVNHANYCISYLRVQKSGTGTTVNYAKKQGLKIINLI